MMVPFFCLVLICNVVSAVVVKIATSVPTVGMGSTLPVDVHLENANSSLVLWPFVDGKQWGAYCTTATQCQLLLPLPTVGEHTIQIAAIPLSAFPHFSVGKPIPDSATVLSNKVNVSVTPRTIAFHQRPTGPAVGMEWEPWFTDHNAQWELHEALPLLGKYDSFNSDVIKQHAIWAVEAGYDFVLVDWTNNLWNKQHWADREVYAQELVNATTFLLDTFASLRSQGIPTPKVVLLPGLDNGPSEPIQALNEEIEFIAQQYLPNYPADLWFEVEGKPLLVVFDGGGIHKPGELAAPQFTVRWMASQLQINSHLAADGYWSWMDGSALPVPIKNNGSIEVTTVTPAYFAAGGWLVTGVGRAGGSTFLSQLASAVAMRPQILVVCQWNEFVGQPNGPPGQQYTDSYNTTLSNDIEPTSLTECGYPRPNDLRCGGWGFFYHNLLAAALRFYEPNFHSTLLVLASPEEGQIVSGGMLHIRWATMGDPTDTFEIFLDGVFALRVSNATSADLDLRHYAADSAGEHTVSVRAPAASTLYPLSATSVDRLTQPVVPQANATFRVVSLAIPAVASTAVGFLKIDTPGYAYGPAIVLERGTYYNFYCSPGLGGAWDVIRLTTSPDGVAWSAPVVALQPGTPYDADSVCDPSVVQFHGVWFLYHTCINTKSAPDGYQNNRICVAVSDSVAGPFRHLPTPVWQDLGCPTNPNVSYCVGQPSAVVLNDHVFLFYTSVYPTDTVGPNNGRVLLATSGDGVSFQAVNGAPLYTQRDVDVKYNRYAGQFFLLQGDVGAKDITWSVSADGVQWAPYSTARLLTVHGPLADGESNNNPGLAGMPDGSFEGAGWAAYGSSFAAGWAQWALYRSDLVVDPPVADCSRCAAGGSCDYACSRTLNTTAFGRCAVPGSADPAHCCECTPMPAKPDCHQCEADGCVTACTRNGRSAGICAVPGSTDPSHCCECF